MTDLYIHGYKLVLTCSACPEQYDVFDLSGTQVAYFRLRHGSFTVAVPDAGGEEVYSASPEGDGMFSDNERLKYLKKGIKAVQKHIANRNYEYKSYD